MTHYGEIFSMGSIVIRAFRYIEPNTVSDAIILNSLPQSRNRREQYDLLEIRIHKERIDRVDERMSPFFECAVSGVSMDMSVSARYRLRHQSKI